MNLLFDTAQKKFNQKLNAFAIDCTIEEMVKAGVTEITPDEVAKHLARDLDAISDGLNEDEKRRLHSCLIIRIACIIDAHRSNGDVAARQFFY